MLHLFGASIKHAIPLERWRRLLGWLHHEHPGLGLVLTGMPAESEVIAEVSAGLPVHAAVGFSMPELIEAIDGAALYVGIDTGVTHLACLLQQKSLVVRHCSDPSWVPDYNPNARILLNSRNCNPEDPTHCLVVSKEGVEYRRCAYDISDKILIESVALALSRKERHVPGFAGIIDEKGSA